MVNEVDTPDFTRRVIIEYLGGFIGLEELAARLGSIIPWDMRGNIVLAESFETEETEWSLEANGGGSAITRQTRRKHSGNWGLKCVVDDVNFALTRAEKYITYSGNAKYALLAMFCFDDTCRRIELAFDLYTGSRKHEGRLRYQRPTKTLSYMPLGGGYTDFETDLTLGTDTFIWYPFILVWDGEAEEYIKAIVAGVEYPLAGIPLHTDDNTDPSYAVIRADCLELDDIGFTSYIDDIILAKNVP